MRLKPAFWQLITIKMRGTGKKLPKELQVGRTAACEWAPAAAEFHAAVERLAVGRAVCSVASFKPDISSVVGEGRY